MNPGQRLFYDISCEFQDQKGGGKKKRRVIQGHLLKSKVLNYNNHKFKQL